MERPETSFAWRGDIALAYQTLGEGSVPILYLQGWPSNVELNWDQQRMARVLRGLARSRKLVVMDVRRKRVFRAWDAGGRLGPLETPGSTIAHIRKYIHTDVRAILPSIHVPTLVFRRADAEDDTPTQSRSTSLLSGFRRPSWSSFPAAIDPPGSATRNRCYA